MGGALSGISRSPIANSKGERWTVGTSLCEYKIGRSYNTSETIPPDFNTCITSRGSPTLMYIFIPASHPEGSPHLCTYSYLHHIQRVVLIERRKHHRGGPVGDGATLFSLIIYGEEGGMQ